MYSIPVTPTRLNGAREERFLRRQRGRSVVPVMPRRAVVRAISMPVAVMKSAVCVCYCCCVIAGCNQSSSHHMQSNEL